MPTKSTKAPLNQARPRTNPYPVFADGDTGWDSKSTNPAKIPNKDYFSSNAKGRFYEGLEWDDVKKIWVPDAASREKEAQRQKELNICPHCGEEIKKCICL